MLTKLRARFPRGSLAHRSLMSGFWSMAELGFGHALRLASNLILTRLLAPEAFGLMAMVTTIQIGVVMLSDIGIRQSIIRAKSVDDPVFLRTAWTVQAVRGLAISLIILACGIGLWLWPPGWAGPDTVYADPVLPFLIMVSALTMQIEALVSVNMHLANRRMEMGRVVLLNLSMQALGVLAMVGLAGIWPSVWALLLGGMLSAAGRVVLSHLIFEGPRMGFAWDRNVRSDLWQFGKWIIGSSALGFLARHADRLILGALMPAAPFGLYVIALLWVQAYTVGIGKLGNQTGLPALSEIHRNRPADLPRLFRKYARVMDLLCLAGFLLFLLAGDDLIRTLYTEDYEGAGRFMALLALLVLTQRFVIFTELLVTTGDSFQLMLSNAASALAICLAIPFGYMIADIPGAIAASIMAPLVGSALQLARAARILGAAVWEDWLWLGGILVIGALLIGGFETSPAP